MKRLLIFVILLALCLSLNGCFWEPAESLYAVPQQPEDFYHLQSAIEKEMPPDGAYCHPITGENQQAVQLADLDGDGENEAVVYLKSTGETPLSICVFKRSEEGYRLVDRVQSAGSTFDRVQYAEINGVPGQEIVVGRRISEQISRSLSVYTLTENGLTELVKANYTELIAADLNSDQLLDLILLRNDPNGSKGIAEYYHWSDGQLLREREARMSTDAAAVKRIITGKMCKDVPAVFVASEYEENTIITDVFGWVEGAFTNLSMSGDAGIGVQTVREYYVYSCDIDGDGLIELPRLIPLQKIPRVETSENQSLICWYNLLLNGGTEEKALTYHNYSSGWYVMIPREWEQELTVSRITVQEGIQGHCFSLLKNGEAEELFTIAAGSGDSRQNWDEGGWERLAAKGETVYYYRLGENTQQLSGGRLADMFRFIQIDWNTGETKS